MSLADAPHRYRQLAADLAADLRAGRYPPGSRLPSVRQLCREQGVSLATVTHALQLLEDEGLVQARPRQGFFARGLASASRVVPGAALALEARRQRLIDLAATQADCLSLGHLALSPGWLPVAALKRLMLRRLGQDPALLAMGTVFGGEALREQLSRQLARAGCGVSAEDIVVCQGEAEALQLCLRLLVRQGERVAIASPAPLRTLELLISLGLQPVEIPAAAPGGLSLPALEAALAQGPLAACIVESHGHPAAVGAMSESAMRATTALLARHRLPLIECDMLGELTRAPQRKPPLKAFDREDWVLYYSGFACITGLGCNLGYVASGRYRLQLRAARTVQGDLLPQLTEQVLGEFLGSEAYARHLRRLRERLAEQVRLHAEAVRAAFPEGTQVWTGEGGHALWITLPPGLDACTLLEAARAQGYTFVPGPVFGLGREFDRCLRLTAAQPLDAVRRRGIALLGALARAQAEARARIQAQ